MNQIATTTFSAEGQVVVYSVTEAKIAELAEEYSRIPSDLSVKDDYEYTRKATAHLRGLRGEVEKRRKELKEDALKWGRLVDSTAKEITEKILDIETPLAAAKKEYDTAVEIAKREAVLAEERRVDAIAERIAKIKAAVEAHISATSAQVATAIQTIELEQENIEEWAMEFVDKAKLAIVDASAKLNDLLQMKTQQEQAAKLAAEQEMKRQAEAEAARVQREKELEADRLRMEKERAEMARQQEEMARQQAELQAAIDKERAEMARKQEELQAAIVAEVKKAERIKQEAEQAEAARVAAEQEAKRQAEAEAVRVEEEKQQAIVDRESTDTPSPEYRAAGNAMLAIIGDKAITKAVLDMIISGDIPHVSFNK